MSEEYPTAFPKVFQMLDRIKEAIKPFSDWKAQTPPLPPSLSDNKCTNDRIENDRVQIEFDRRYADYYLGQFAKHMEQALMHLRLHLRMGEAVFYIRTSESDQSGTDSSSTHLKNLAHEVQQSPSHDPISHPSNDSPLIGKPESSNREGINPIASTPAVVD